MSTSRTQITAPLPIPDPPPAPHRRKRRLPWILSIFLFLVLAIPLLLLSLMGAIYWQARTDETVRSDAIVVLGAAQWNGRPTDVLQARLDHALTLYEDGYAPVIIVTGGKQVGDAFTEAETSRNYLVDRGVPESAILLENTSHSTWGNIDGIHNIDAAENIHSLLIVSDGFHLFRAEMMARHAGFEVHSSAAPGSPIKKWSGTEFSYVVRETAGVIAFLPKYLP